MTYSVSSGTLNPSIPYQFCVHTTAVAILSLVMLLWVYILHPLTTTVAITEFINIVFVAVGKSGIFEQQRQNELQGKN